MNIDDYFKKYLQLIKEEEIYLILYDPKMPKDFRFTPPANRFSEAERWEEINNNTDDVIIQVQEYLQSPIIEKYSSRIRKSINTVKKIFCKGKNTRFFFIIIDINSKWTELEKYLPKNNGDSIQHKKLIGLANKLDKYIKGASDNLLEDVINKKKIDEKLLWIGSAYDASRFAIHFRLTDSEWNKCFHFKNEKKLHTDKKRIIKKTFKEEDGKLEISNILANYKM